MTVTTTLTAATTVPQRDDPDNFRADADDFVDWQANTLVPEVNDVISEINSTTEDINSTVQGLFVGTSTTSITIGTGSKTFTMAEETLAFAAGNNLRIADSDNPTTNYMEGVVTSYTKATKQLIVTISSTNGSGTISAWTMTLAPPIDFNRVRSYSGLTGAVSMPFLCEHNGEYYMLVTNTSDVTADVPGVSNKWVRFGFPTYQEFLSSGTWTKPDGCNYVYVEAVGGGGGGYNNTGVTGYEFGGSGAEFLSRTLKAEDIGSTETVTIGAGGSGGASGGTGAGSNGGNSSFGTHVEAYGGRGGGIGSTQQHYSTPLRAPQAWSNYDKIRPLVLYYAGYGGSQLGDPGTDCIYGGAGGGGPAGGGGASVFGGDGGDGNSTTSTAASNGSVPGGGGGASTNDGGGGNGGEGRVRVWTW